MSVLRADGIRWEHHDGARIATDAALRDRIASVYSETFSEPPYDEPADRGPAWAHDALVRHAALPAFCLVTAEDDAGLLGFSYGVIGSEDSWFAGYIRDHAPLEVAQRWLGGHGGHGELAELAVRPRARGRGLGGALHDAVIAHLADAGVERTILVTQTAAAPARALYVNRGWRDLAELASGSMLMGLLSTRGRGHSTG